jgi:hypothetical protein
MAPVKVFSAKISSSNVGMIPFNRILTRRGISGVAF